jgi:site-specific recombinase XerC
MGHISLHDARHTHASLMLKEGIHPKIVQERLGHASIQTTLDIYSHVAPGLQEAAAVRFDEIFVKRTKNQASEMGSYPLAKTGKSSVSKSQKEQF